MQYTVRCGKKYQLKIERQANISKDIEVHVGRKSYHVQIKDINPDGTIRTVSINNRVYPVSVYKRNDGFPAQVVLNGTPFDVNIEKVESTRYKPKAPDRTISGKIRSSLPGQIVTVLVKKGERVRKGQPLLILESMKMENEILSPKNGVVSKIHVKQKQVVMKSHLLIEIS